MKRYLNIFLLHFANLLEYRSRSFVWFLLAFFNPLLLFIFWYGALKGENSLPESWNLSTLTSYYFLLMIATSLLMAHIEEDVARIDISEGQLAKYLLKPFSYYWSKFFMEAPHRIFQGSMGLIVFLIFLTFFGRFLSLAQDPLVIFLSLLITVLAFFISFTYKMIVGIIAFWLIDIGGFFQLVDLTLLIFGGFVIPLELLPGFLEKLSYILPFSYMIYFPITAFQGKFEVFELSKIILGQVTWLLIFIYLYKKLWAKGIKAFTAVGQ